MALAGLVLSVIKLGEEVQYFDDNGRRLPGAGIRTFSVTPSNYYQLEQPALDYVSILGRISRHLSIGLEISASDFEGRADALVSKVKSSAVLANLAKGVFVPFAFRRIQKRVDLGSELESYLLPGLQKSFLERFPAAHFKAVLQGDSELANSISIDPQSQYENFIDCSERQTVVGIYFPQALQEFDVASQRKQMHTLPKLPGASICLSGGIDICAALTGIPELLISGDHYAPMPIMSSYVHSDERLVLLLKAYGPHLEFWCMTQMLAKNIKQVSEQWTGGLTVHEVY